MQRALTPVNSSVNDCFADDAEEVAEETDTPLASVSIRGRTLFNLRLADDIDLPGSSEEELQRLSQRLEETAAEYGMEIRSNDQKFSLTASNQDPLPTYRLMDERTKWTSSNT